MLISSPIHIWDSVPSWDTFCAQVHAQPQTRHWVLLAENHHLQTAWNQPLCNTLNPRGISLYPLSESALLWVFPPQYRHLMAQHFSGSQSTIQPIAHTFTQKNKPWFRLPETSKHIEHVLIIGGGIAAATTARALADRGITVSVFTEHQLADAASGNRQGLLYAKVSPHNTAQSQLLFQAYGYTLGLLQKILPKSDYWQQCGIIHLDENPSTQRRHAAIASQKSPLYQLISQQEASQISGVNLPSGGLFWPFGAWVHPPALVRALCTHPHIQVHEHHHIENIHHTNGQWQIASQNQHFSGSHLVLCTGAKRHLIQQWGLDIASIRGQTSVCDATNTSCQLKTAISGAGYISPAWQDQHCFGATFQPNCADDAIDPQDNQNNLEMLQTIYPPLYQELSTNNTTMRAHAAVRADAFDHLPMVGAVGDASKMRAIYHKLADDKNYPIQAACPFLPNAYVNIAHGSRGLLTAPLAGLAVAAEILGDAHPLPENLRIALSPNRVIIRNIIKSKEQSAY